MNHRLLKNKTFISVVVALILWGAAFYFISPDALIERIGIGNAYIVAFLVALIAGFSSFTGTAAYATVIGFAQGGVDPLVLGIVAGIGLFLSDSAFYLLAMRGREALSLRFGKWLSRFQRHVEQLPPFAILLGTYLFCAFGPIPNDIIIAVLIVGGYHFKKIWPALLAGDVTLMLVLSYLFQA